MKTANDVNPIIIIEEINKPFILSKMNVFKSVLLKPYFSSITKVE